MRDDEQVDMRVSKDLANLVLNRRVTCRPTVDDAGRVAGACGAGAVDQYGSVSDDAEDRIAVVNGTRIEDVNSCGHWSLIDQHPPYTIPARTG